MKKFKGVMIELGKFPRTGEVGVKTAIRGADIQDIIDTDGKFLIEVEFDLSEMDTANLEKLN